MLMSHHLAAPGDMLPILQVRVVGTSGVFRAPVRHCSRQLAMTSVVLPSPGVHMVEVVMEAKRFSLCDIPSTSVESSPSEVSPWLGFLSVAHGMDGGTLLTWSEEPLPFASLPSLQQPWSVPVPETACTDGMQRPFLMRGRFGFARWPAPEADLLVKSCVYDDAKNGTLCRTRDPASPLWALQRKGTSSSLAWQPYGCSLKPTSEIGPKGCLGSRRVCVAGDSHARHLAISLSAWAGKLHTDPSTWNTTLMASIIADPVKLINSPWGDWAAMAEAVSDCDVLIANFGLWGASHQTHAHPWDAYKYAQAVENLAAHLRGLKASGMKVYFISTDASPMTYFRLTGKDWRFGPVLDAYNILALRVMRQYEVPFIDTSLPSRALPHASFDGNHFAWGSVVGDAITNLVLNYICG